MRTEFIPGLQLAEEFYDEVVRPLLDQHFPGLTYSASLIGPGSEVLGFDTARSMDHDWGPRLQILIDDGAPPESAPAITAMLDRELPTTFRDLPTRFPPEDRHRVVVAPAAQWAGTTMGFDPTSPVDLESWLATPSTVLASFTAGKVFHDGLGTITRTRANLAWYPDDLWRYVLACQWQRIGQEEPFPGRCAEAGDDLGSAVVTAGLVRDLMRLCLLMSRRYPPYSKWLGTAFSRLPVAESLGPQLARALSATHWPDRESGLTGAYRMVATSHNKLGLTQALDTEPSRFHTRPYDVLGGEGFAAALQASISDPRIKELPLVGAVYQFMDSTDALKSPITRAAVAGLQA